MAFLKYLSRIICSVIFLLLSQQSFAQYPRSFDFDVVDGKIQEMKESQLGYEPATDFILPRVQKKVQRH